MSETRPVVLVTGSSRGLGKSMAVAFAKQGYAVAIHYHQSEAAAQSTVNEVMGLGVPAIMVRADIRSSKAVTDMIESVEEHWDRLDVLVCNAGLVRNRTIAKMSDDEWDDVLKADVTGPFYCMRAVIPVMRRQNGGAIISIGSFIGQRGSVGAANYASAKAALAALTKSVALEEGRHNIRANVVLPGFHVTDMNKDYWEKHESTIRSQQLLPTMPDREELAQFVVHVASLKSVTAQVLPFESRNS